MRLHVSSNSVREGDWELVSKAREGDQLAFSDLVRRYQDRIYNTVYGLVGDRDDADDVAQEAFVKAYRSLGRFRGNSSFYTWIYRIAVNTCLDWMKSRARRSDVPIDRDVPGSPDAASPLYRPPESADTQALRNDLHRVLQEALSALSPEFRVTTVLREIDGLSYGEISSILGCSTGTVKSRLFRARSQLRLLLEDQHGEWFSG